MKFKLSDKTNFLTFLICVALAVIFWIFTNLSETYEKEITVALEPVNVPFDKKVKLNTQTVTVSFKTTGFQLLFKNFKNKTIPIISEWQLDGKEIKIITNELLSSKLGNVKISAVYPSEISASISKLYTKKVPVKVNYTNNLAKNHFVHGDIIIEPDSILVTGNKDSLSSTTFIETENLEITGKEPISRNIVLNTNLKVKKKKVEVYFPIEEFTELKIDKPIQVKDSPKNLDYLYYPEIVNARFLIPISEYNSFDVDDLSFYIDLSIENVKDLKTVEIKKDSIPNFIKNFQINPKEVNLIIYL